MYKLLNYGATFSISKLCNRHLPSTVTTNKGSGLAASYATLFALSQANQLCFHNPTLFNLSSKGHKKAVCIIIQDSCVYVVILANTN